MQEASCSDKEDSSGNKPDSIEEQKDAEAIPIVGGYSTNPAMRPFQYGGKQIPWFGGTPSYARWLIENRKSQPFPPSIQFVPALEWSPHPRPLFKGDICPCFPLEKYDIFFYT